MNNVDQRFFDQVAAELSRNFLDQGLWARAIAENYGDEAKARASYIARRALALSEQAKAASHPANWSDEKKTRVEASRKKMLTACWKFSIVLFCVVTILVLFFIAVRNT